MYEFNLQNFLNDVYVSSQDGTGDPQSIAVNCTVRITADQRDDFTAAVSSFLQNLKNYLNLPDTSDCYWQDPVSPDIIVMHEHGFMDGAGGPGNINSMIFATVDNTDSGRYLYVNEYNTTSVGSDSTAVGTGH